LTGVKRALLLPWAETKRVAAVLKAARKASGKRQPEVARALGWSVAKVSQTENAVSRLSLAGARAFAEAVGAGEDELGLGAVSRSLHEHAGEAVAAVAADGTPAVFGDWEISREDGGTVGVSLHGDGQAGTAHEELDALVSAIADARGDGR
jgi:transcriptional regulator with XRE-family HTH domain